MMVTRSYAQDTPDALSTLCDQALNIFLDFDRGDHNFIRTEITYVNYVRDRTQADVHVLATTQRSGSGGAGYRRYEVMKAGGIDPGVIDDDRPEHV